MSSSRHIWHVSIYSLSIICLTVMGVLDSISYSTKNINNFRAVEWKHFSGKFDSKSLSQFMKLFVSTNISIATAFYSVWGAETRGIILRRIRLSLRLDNSTSLSFISEQTLEYPIICFFKFIFYIILTSGSQRFRNKMCVYLLISVLKLLHLNSVTNFYN